jgi:hypothetical protein
MKRPPKPEPEATFEVTLSESELNLLVSSLEYMASRQSFLENLAINQGRDREALARRESAGTTAALSERLYAIGAKEGK